MAESKYGDWPVYVCADPALADRLAFEYAETAWVVRVPVPPQETRARLREDELPLDSLVFLRSQAPSLWARWWLEDVAALARRQLPSGA